MRYSNCILGLLFSAALMGLLVPFASAQDRITITYWRPAYDVERDVTIRMVAAFEARYPHIRIDMAPTFHLLSSATGGHIVLRIDSVSGVLRGAIGVRHGRDPLGTGGERPENRADGAPCMDRPHEAGNCSRAVRFAAVAAGRCRRVRLVVRVTENRPASPCPDYFWMHSRATWRENRQACRRVIRRLSSCSSV